MKKITLLLFTIGVFATFGFSILQGGNDPIPGIDVIIVRRPRPVIANPIDIISINKETLKKISSFANEERSVYISKVITPIIEKATKEKGLGKIILKGLLETRCIECKSFETFTFIVPSKIKGNEYSITLNVKFDKKWITVITDRGNFEKPIENPYNFDLLDTVNELESKLKSEKRKDLAQKFKNEFYRIEGHIGKEYKTKEQVFNAYITSLKKKISEQKPNKTKATSYGSTRSNRNGIINTEKKPTLKKAVKTNVNTSRSNKKQQ